MPDLVTDALAAYRVTRLLQEDAFPPAEALRRAVEKRGGALAEMWECPWCLGMWASLAVIAARLTAPRAWAPLSQALAASAAVAALRASEWRLEPPEAR